jgi:hypothetical protein
MAIFSHDTIDRVMSGGERCRVAMEMSDFARDVVLDRLRRENPELPEQAIMDIYLTCVLGWKLPGRWGASRVTTISGTSPARSCCGPWRPGRGSSCP